MSLLKPVILVIKNAHNATAKATRTAKNAPLECITTTECATKNAGKVNMLTEVLSNVLNATKSATIALPVQILHAYPALMGSS
jgi:hypothetical protein